MEKESKFKPECYKPEVDRNYVFPSTYSPNISFKKKLGDRYVEKCASYNLRGKLQNTDSNKMSASTDLMNQLMKKKDELEAEIKELNDVLESQKGVGMKEALVDTEGYPRADIDIYSVRHARHQVVCLQNDHKDIMKQIEEELYRIHDQARLNKQESMDTGSGSNSDAVQERLSPFAVIDRVDEGSPAAQSGLQVGDKVLQFGSVTHKNFQSLQSIGTLVQHSKEKSLPVRIDRNGEEKNLSLTPKTWSGRGLLGCNIVPVKK